MPTRSQTVTDEPTEVADLTDGTTYRGWCRGRRRLFIANAGAKPATDDPAVSLRPGQSMKLRATADEPVYVWADGEGADLVYVEEPA